MKKWVIARILNWLCPYLQVSAEGVKRIEPLNYEQKGAIEFSTIGFSTVVKHKYWCIICPDGQNEATVEVYRCAGDRAFDIAAAITAGFKEAQKLKNSNPFAATGERTSAPESLFRKQVHRGELKADRPIGAGQFGVSISIECDTSGTITISRIEQRGVIGSWSERLDTSHAWIMTAVPAVRGSFR